jgi:hypothetical protein
LGKLDEKRQTMGFVIIPPKDIEVFGQQGYGVGDINGDGFDDVILNAPVGFEESSKGRSKAFLIYGGSSRYSPLNLSDSHDGSSFVVIEGSEKKNRFGVGGAGGDFNGDGFSDFLMLAPNEHKEHSPDASNDYNRYSPEGSLTGIAYIFFGANKNQKDGMVSELGIRSPVQFPITTLHGLNAYDRFGTWGSHIGDINADGFSDIALMATNEGLPDMDSPNPNSTEGGKEGVVTVLFGNSKNLSVINHRGFGTESLEQGFKILGKERGHKVGLPLIGLGDINADGYDDFIMGAGFATDTASSKSLENYHLTGEAFIMFGKPNGYKNIRLKELTPDDGFRLSSIELFDAVGTGMSGIGDFNGDGVSDLVVSAYRAKGRNNDLKEVGEVYVIYGSDEPNHFSDFNLSELTPDKGFTIYGANEQSYFGAQVYGVGDVNGDGYSDIIISKFDSSVILDKSEDIQEAPDLKIDADPGSVIVLFGRPNQPEDIDLAKVESINGFELAGNYLYAYTLSSFGYFVGPPEEGVNYKVHGEYRIDILAKPVGDMNGDGISDILVGCGREDWSIIEKAPYAYIIYGEKTEANPTYKAYLRAGNVPPKGIGLVGDGSHISSPSSRCWIGFNRGGAEKNQASLQSVTLHRIVTGAENSEKIAGEEPVAETMWHVTTNREGWQSAELIFKYTESDIEHFQDMEARLSLYRSESPQGPWVELESTTDVRKNRISAQTQALGYFAIKPQSP